MELMGDGAVRNRGRYLAPYNDACSYSQPALWLPLETMMELGTDMQAAIDAVRVKSAVRRLLGSQVDDIEHWPGVRAKAMPWRSSGTISRIARLIDHPPKVLVARGEIQDRELARADLTAADVYALLRQQGVDDLGQVGYLLYETRGSTTLIGAEGEPGPLMRDGLFAAGYCHVAKPVERHVRQQCQRMLPHDGIDDSSRRTQR
jgi:hypothetical protein